ncbi:MAG TPA: maleylpyruvate isomerase family mycothiol-dependent enzyme [Nocardioidaceae bacterium]|nr:maleylpyruvate isomerase family mycothiol-dependent enzyme [Nocardioidaceae bacterium]
MAFSRYAAVPAVDFVSAFATLAAELGTALESCDVGARVPACPRWSTYDLVVHLGNVHAWAATIVETGKSTPSQNDEPRSHRPRDLSEWYVGKAGDLLAVLRDADPHAECWTLSPADRTKGFWQRRQAHETLVHLVDLHQASGSTTDVPARLAADGVAEVLEVFLPRMHARGRHADLTAPLLLSTTDTDDTWLVTPGGPGAPPESRPVGGSDLVDRGTDLVTATAADLMLLLWKRVSPDQAGVTLDGDRGRLLRFLESPLTP